ncbi:MAG: ferritin [Firmicutes bacterium]|nr:ferritin [Dethiobacter sp.]MBS3887804.1 ferritin [Bacillota bacterium]
MLSQKLTAELNLQVMYELYSAHLYLAMAAYCTDQQLDGFAHWFKIQAEEEKFHAMLIFDFIADMGGRVKMQALAEPENEYASVVDVYEKSLHHEQFVSQRFYHLMDIAQSEKEHATISFLKWFVDEQREEEKSFGHILQQVKRFGGEALYHLDKELATRTFTPPVMG